MKNSSQNKKSSGFKCKYMNEPNMENPHCKNQTSCEGCINSESAEKNNIYAFIYGKEKN